MKAVLTIAFALVLSCSASAAWAALAPNYQRLAELHAVLTHPQIIAAFPVGQPIDKIEYIEPDLYRVTAGDCHIDAKIVSKPAQSGMVGPRQFTVEPGQPFCK